MAEMTLRDMFLKERDTGILVVGHGTRSGQGCQEMLGVAENLAQRLAPLPVEAGFLEMAQPPLKEAIDRLVEKGVKTMVVAPLLLFAAGHAKRDIPNQVEQALKKQGHIQIAQIQPLGRTKPIIALSCLRLQRALDTHAYLPPSQTALLLVGRGSPDKEAVAEMFAFSKVRSALANFASVAPSFLAMAEPSLEEAIEQLGTKQYRRIVVQPHLLFHGRLLQKLEEIVQAASVRFPDSEWISPAHLGPHPLLVEAVEAEILRAAQELSP